MEDIAFQNWLSLHESGGGHLHLGHRYSADELLEELLRGLGLHEEFHVDCDGGHLPQCEVENVNVDFEVVLVMMVVSGGDVVEEESGVLTNGRFHDPRA